MVKKIFCLIFVCCLSVTAAKAQTAEVNIQLNEQFFDALLDSLFQNGGSPEFPISKFEIEEKKKDQTTGKSAFSKTVFENEQLTTETGNREPVCSETIRLLRELGGVRTDVNLRDGRIFAPIAFTGSYNPPLLGCVEFSGVADTNIVLEFDQQRQALIGRAAVTNVNLNGSGGIGGSVLARLVQGSIDRKINPIEIIKLDKISFMVPIQNAGNLRLKAVAIRHEITNGVLNVRVAYQFTKG